MMWVDYVNRTILGRTDCACEEPGGLIGGARAVTLGVRDGLYSVAVEPFRDTFQWAREYVGSRIWNYRAFTIVDYELTWIAQTIVSWATAQPGSPVHGQKFGVLLCTPIIWTGLQSAWKRWGGGGTAV